MEKSLWLNEKWTMTFFLNPSWFASQEHRVPGFDPVLTTVFGGMYFYHSICNFMPMPNAAFGSS